MLGRLNRSSILKLQVQCERKVGGDLDSDIPPPQFV